MIDTLKSTVLLISLCLFLTACGGGSNSGSENEIQIPDELDSSFSSEATGRLASSSFRFPPGSGIFEDGDPRESMTAVLTMGRLNRSNTFSAFTITSPDGSVEGGFFLGTSPCSFEFNYSRRAGATPIVGTGVRSGGYFDQCGIDQRGRLALLAFASSDYLVSEPGQTLRTDLYRSVALTEAAVVETPPAVPSGAVGAVELYLTGQVLSFTAAIQGLPSVENFSLTIHPGLPTENTAAAITLVGFSAEPLRELNFNAFTAGVAAGSVLLSEADAASIADGVTPYYIQVSSFFRPNGLLRGQVTPQVSRLDKPLVIADESVASGSVFGETPQQISVSLGGGSTATLLAPANAAGMSTTQTVTMAPVRAVVGVPLVGGALAGVRLAPDQTFFEEPLILRFKLAKGFNPSSIVALSIDELSGEYSFLPLSPAAVQDNEIEVVVHHFTDVVIGNTDTDNPSSEMPPVPQYDHWRDRIAQVLTQSSIEQYLGIDTDRTEEIDLLLVRALSETILPLIEGVTDRASFDRAFIDFKTWIQDIQSYSTESKFTLSIGEAGLILATKIEALVALLEQQCLNSTDACEKLRLLEEHVNWISRAQVLESVAGAIADIPPYEEFCGALATQQGAGTRLFVKPSPLFAFPGVAYDFEVTATDANLIDYPVPQAQWSLTPPSANTIDPSSGQGVALKAGVYEVTVVDPTICADPGKSVLNVKDFSGTWDVVQKAESVTCPEDFKFQRNYQVQIVQSNDNARIAHPTFGPVDAKITGFMTTRTAEETPLFGIDTGLVTTASTNFCAQFFQDVGAALNDKSCFPPNVCEPLSCEETYHVTGTFDEYGNILDARNQWSDTLSWNLISPGNAPSRIETFCSGTDKLSLTRSTE